MVQENHAKQLYEILIKTCLSEFFSQNSDAAGSNGVFSYLYSSSSGNRNGPEMFNLIFSYIYIYMIELK